MTLGKFLISLYWLKRKFLKVQEKSSKLLHKCGPWLQFCLCDLIPEDSSHYKSLCILLKISSMATAREISLDTVDYMRVLIEEHHVLFRTLYPDASILPKMHYMVHYPSQVYRFGPLVTTWTMRYEAKLSILKRVSRHRNFKNICYTASKRHQHLLCYHLNSKFLLYKELTHGKCSMAIEIADCDIELKDTIVRYIPNVNQHDSVFTTSWVDAKEMSLKLGMFLLLRTEGSYPIFGKINLII